ncbi:Citrinin biosynthesis cluster MFS transporter mrr1 [Pseudocercospora fuligena]|uniref:Cercosporin MFS transporter CTB4 n=1 Tax=Pseudocercospora fuligena TaxID=685502 RepID=A0A8H6RJW5_9PEZI|nr:Citrinin biosynthesis cluster MFS transporter mrr1 [Pseudocercospora fuligena]
MLDSSHPFAVSNMSTTPNGQSISRGDSGVPLTGADGQVQWLRPSQENNRAPSQTLLPEKISEESLDENRKSDMSQANTLHHKSSNHDLQRQFTNDEKDKDSDVAAEAGIPPLAESNDYDVDVEKQQHIQDHNQTPEDQLGGKKDEEDEQDPNVVGWDGPDDPKNPMNWSPYRKWAIAVNMGLMTFVVTFASSVLSSAVTPTSMEFGVSEEVMVLMVSLFVLGFAFGPVFWGPISELYGRKIPLFSGYLIFAIFQVPVAVAQNLQTIMICRFFGGFFASAPLAIVGGALADFFDPVNRGVALSLFGAATFIGPTMGPILGGFITMSHLGWRWTQWITMIMAGLFGGIGVFVIPETFEPRLLQLKAKKLKYQTRNWALHAPADEKEVNLEEIAEKYILRPFKMLMLEPILVLITLYVSLIYGIIYLFFESFPISFQQERGYNLGVGALPFLAVLVGVVFGCLTITGITYTRTARIFREAQTIVPEERLIPMIIGGCVLPIGMFWFGWTSSNHISPWPQIISSIPIGMGVILIFLQGLNYIIDVYKINANSAIAANTFFRSWVGAGFPMFATPMFKNLGVPWAMSLLGFLCVAMIPVPILYYIYGERIRKLSRYSPD